MMSSQRMPAHAVLLSAVWVFSLCGLLKIVGVSSQEMCRGPIEAPRVTGIQISPDIEAATFIQMNLTSAYPLDVQFWVARGPARPIGFTGERNGIKATKSCQNGEYTISIESREPQDLAEQQVNLLMHHPCNTVGISLSLITIQDIHRQGLNLPAVSLLPKARYVWNQRMTMTLRYGVMYPDDGRPWQQYDAYSFSEFYRWNDTNLMKLAEKRSNFGRNLKTELYTNVTSDGFRMVTGETIARPKLLKARGIILTSGVDLMIDLTSYSSTIYMFYFTAVRFEETETLPMLVEGYPGEPLHLRAQRLGGVDILQVGVNIRESAERRVLSCGGAGVERAPVVSVYRLGSTGEISARHPVDVLYPGVHIGPVGFGEFEANITVGGHEYYLCRAATGGIVSGRILNVTGYTSLRVRANVRTTNDTNGVELHCNANGLPRAEVRIFFIPLGRITNGVYEYDTKKYPEIYKDYEVTGYPSTTVDTSSGRAVTLVVPWTSLFEQDRLYKDVATLRCLASNGYETRMSTKRNVYPSYAVVDAYRKKFS